MVGSVDSFGGEAQERRLIFCAQIRHGRGARFEIEGVEFGMSWFSKNKRLVTSTEGNIGEVREVEGEKATDDDEGGRVDCAR